MRRSTAVFVVLLILAVISARAARSVRCEKLRSSVARPHSVTVTEFGAVGDGVTLNTLAFQNAIFYLQTFANKGGAQLFVPAGRWLTGSFNLISHLTLSLDEGAVIVGSAGLYGQSAKSIIVSKGQNYNPDTENVEVDFQFGGVGVADVVIGLVLMFFESRE